jgi:hypothetical protein
MYENIIAIHNVFFKKSYIVKFSTSSIFKKISKNNFKTKNFFFFKKRRNQFWIKKHVKKNCCYMNIPHVLEYSIINSPCHLVFNSNLNLINTCNIRWNSYKVIRVN